LGNIIFYRIVLVVSIALRVI